MPKRFHRIWIHFVSYCWLFCWECHPWKCGSQHFNFFGFFRQLYCNPPRFPLTLRISNDCDSSPMGLTLCGGNFIVLYPTWQLWWKISKKNKKCFPSWTDDGSRFGCDYNSSGDHYFELNMECEYFSSHFYDCPHFLEFLFENCWVTRHRNYVFCNDQSCRWGLANNRFNIDNFLDNRRLHLGIPYWIFEYLN